MEEMRAELRKVLDAALENRRRDDALEQAVGREARRAGLSYHEYTEVMEMVRERARKGKLDAWESAKAILKEQKEK